MSSDQHDPRLRRLLHALPSPVRRAYAWLIRPESRWARWPLGLALMVGGVLGFLPVLGLWMLQLGALLLGQDIPPLHRLTLNLLGRVQRCRTAGASGGEHARRYGGCGGDLRAPSSARPVPHRVESRSCAIPGE